MRTQKAWPASVSGAGAGALGALGVAVSSPWTALTPDWAVRL